MRTLRRLREPGTQEELAPVARDTSRVVNQVVDNLAGIPEIPVLRDTDDLATVRARLNLVIMAINTVRRNS